MSDTATRFDAELINVALSADPHYASALPDGIRDYAGFREAVGAESPEDLKRRVLHQLQRDDLKGATFYTTSGTSGQVKLLLNAAWRRRPDHSYGLTLAKLLMSKMLSPTDRVANLFTAGGFSTLFDGCNRMLEAIGANVLPIGRLDVYGGDLRAVLDWIGVAQPNVLLGTPTSVMQCMQLLEEYGIEIDVKAILYTGEPISEKRREAILRRWPRARLYGLYGATETGFIGYNTPECAENHYHVFDDWFLLEEVEGQLLVTSWANASLPLIRYRLGDRVRVGARTCSCGEHGSMVTLEGRSDRRFKYAGNLISADLLGSHLALRYGRTLDYQLHLSMDDAGRDHLTVAVDLADDELAPIADELRRALHAIEDLRECVDRGMGEIHLAGREAFRFSTRQKLPVLIDTRQPRVQ